mgnify:CR=1 FL=1
MKKGSYHLKSSESFSVVDTGLVTDDRSYNYSLTKLAEVENYDILIDDEENIGCQLKGRPENDVVDLFGNKVIDDF